VCFLFRLTYFPVNIKNETDGRINQYLSSNHWFMIQPSHAGGILSTFGDKLLVTLGLVTVCEKKF